MAVRTRRIRIVRTTVLMNFSISLSKNVELADFYRSPVEAVVKTAFYSDIVDMGENVEPTITRLRQKRHANNVIIPTPASS